MSVKIAIDENIPYAYDLFAQFGDVELFSGRSIPADLLKKSDALIIRSITKINSGLLVGSKVKFVGTATSGVDHVDQSYLLDSGIFFSSAAGCNSISVAEYVVSVLLWLAKRDQFFLCDKVVGIIGLGNIGSCLYKKLNCLGVPTLVYDPLLSIKSDCINFCSLEKLVSESEILTFHVPLVCDTPYATWHMVSGDLLEVLSENCILINTSRGSVVDNAALLRILESGKKLKVVLDVWENEPKLLLPLLEYIEIGTPHIAGFTLEGKMRGTMQVFNAYKDFLGITQCKYSIPFPLPPDNYFEVCEDVNQDILFCLSHFLYNVVDDDILFRRNVGLPDGFDMLRKSYLVRKEWSSICIKSSNINFDAKFRNLGFNVFGD